MYRVSRLFEGVVVLACGMALYGQTGAVVGSVRGEDGSVVAGAYVTVSAFPDTMPTAEPPFHSTTRTGTDGTFSLSSVPPGKLRICAQAPGSEWISSCQWSAGGANATLSAGQTLNLPIAMARAYRLQIVFEDKNRHLEKNNLKGASLMAGAIGPNGMFNAAAVTEQNNEGQIQEVLVPYDTDLTVTVTSAKVSLADEKGVALDRQKGGIERIRIPRGIGAGRRVRFLITGITP